MSWGVNSRRESRTSIPSLHIVETHLASHRPALPTCCRIHLAGTAQNTYFCQKFEAQQTLWLQYGHRRHRPPAVCTWQKQHRTLPLSKPSLHTVTPFFPTRLLIFAWARMILNSITLSRRHLMVFMLENTSRATQRTVLRLIWTMVEKLRSF